MSTRTQVNIDGYTVDDDVTLSDDIFNIVMGASLVLLGTDVLVDDAVSGSGRVSVNGPTTIDEGLTLTGDAVFVDTTSVTQSGDLLLGQTASDATTARNIAAATWTVETGGITGAGSSQFVNLGELDFVGSVSTIDADFYDRGGEIHSPGEVDFASPGDINRFIDDTIDVGSFDLSGGVLVGSTISATNIINLDNVRIVGDVSLTAGDFKFGFDTINLAAGSVLSLISSSTNTANPSFSGFNGEIVGGGEIDIGTNFTVGSLSVHLVGAVTFKSMGDDYYYPTSPTEVVSFSTRS